MSVESKDTDIPSYVLAELEDLTCDNYILSETLEELIRCVQQRGDIEPPRGNASEEKH